MGDWFEYIAAMTLFLLSHVIPVRPPVRPWLVGHLGLRGYLVGYSVVSVALLVWLIGAAARAPYVQVIPAFDALRWAPLIVMPMACLLAVQGMGATNPLSFGGMGKRPFDPERPGILGVTRHPLLLAVILWALVHLLANGDLAHVILFGLFALFAALSMWLIDRRKQRLMGAAWQRMAQNTARWSVRGSRPGLWSGLVAVGVFVALLVLHAPLIGVSPLP
jgi:uncharacterized membrane protein